MLLLLASQSMQAQVSFGETSLFNDGWLFLLQDVAEAKNPDFNDSSWRKLSLPHDWSIEGQLSQEYASCTGYLPAGIAWYRKHFKTPDGFDGNTTLSIYFEAIYNRSEVYLNGHLLGKRPNGYVSFLYDMTPYLNKKGENVIAVRVDHSRIADSRWYTGSGIYRDVWLVKAPQVHLSQWGVAYRLKQLQGSKATVEVDVAVDAPKATKANYSTAVVLKDAASKQVADGRIDLGRLAKGQTKRTMEISLNNPQLWNLKRPYLYRLEVSLFEGNAAQAIDTTSVRVGLRTLQFDANKGFALNGEWMKVKGVCLHHDAGVLGAAVPREVWVRKVKELKRMGANAIRMSHNPQAPMLYDICDQEGLLVMDEGSDEWEFPKKKWVEGWNNGKPAFDGTYDFFEEWIDRDVADMVRRDRNHPCVFLWSVGNEVDYPNDPYSHPILDGKNAVINQPVSGGYKKDAPNAERIGKIAKRIAAVIRGIDTSRPVTGALAGVVMSNQTEYPEAIDVVGYNYTENRYDIDHKEYPQRIIYGSETGVGYDSWKAVRDKEHIFGQFIWTGTDYLGESGRWPSRGLNTGLLDFGSFKKPRGWFRAALWSEEPVCYIGAYPIFPQRANANGSRRGRGGNQVSAEAQDDWNLPDLSRFSRFMGGQQNAANQPAFDASQMNMRVVCYTNASQARLLLNGRVVGELKPQNDTTAIIFWDIPFEAGTLRAEGCDANGKVLSSYEIKTHGEASAIRASELLPEDAKTLHQLLVEVVDKDGNRVKSSNLDVTCTISGPAVLLGLEGCNNSDMSDYRDNHQPVYRGRLVAYIRRTAPGPVRVTFSGEGVSSTTMEF